MYFKGTYIYMDFNNISIRLKRIYTSVNARVETKLDRAINLVKTSKSFKITFDKHSEDPLNKIFIILHNLANLKDHLKIILNSKGGNRQDIENEINNSLHLKIIIDLSNADKHGYPTRSNRSQLNPQIKNVRHSLHVKKTEDQPQASFSINMLSGNHSTNSVAKVVIAADVVDQNENFIMSLDQLINSGLTMWEKILKKYNIQ